MNAAELGTDEAPWVIAHEALSRLAKARAMADAEEGRWLLAATRSAVHVHLGFSGFGEYIERLFGYSRRLTREKVRVAEALEGLPAVMRALEAGVLSWSAVRELTRVAAGETEHEWLAVAQGKTVRQLEELVAGKSPGDTPDSPANDGTRRHVLRFDVAAETLALFRQATAALRRRSGSSLSDDAVLMEMARQVLGGPKDEGRSSYQIAVTMCAECGRGRLDAGSDTVSINAEVVAMACCDAQHLGRVDSVPANDALARSAWPRATQDVPAGNDAPSQDATGARTEPRATPYASAANERGQVAPRAKPDVLPGAAARSAHVRQRARPAIPPDRALSAFDPERRATPGVVPTPSTPIARTGRATQSIPPSVRRAVLRRDQNRCRVPGCTHGVFPDLHHIVLRSEGGRNEATNLITVCGSHDRALHRGELEVERDGSVVRFRCADGSVYGGVANPKLSICSASFFPPCAGSGFARARCGARSPRSASAMSSTARAFRSGSARPSRGSRPPSGEVTPAHSGERSMHSRVNVSP